METPKKLRQKRFISRDDRGSIRQMEEMFTPKDGFAWFVESRESHKWVTCYGGKNNLKEEFLTLNPLEAMRFETEPKALKYIIEQDEGQRFIATEHEFVKSPSNKEPLISQGEIEQIVYLKMLDIKQDNGLSLSAKTRQRVKKSIAKAIASKLSPPKATTPEGASQSAETFLKSKGVSLEYAKAVSMRAANGENQNMLELLQEYASQNKGDSINKDQQKKLSDYLYNQHQIVLTEVDYYEIEKILKKE